jgi:hypothetical protein
MSTRPESENQLEMPELGAAFSIDNHIWDAGSLNAEIEPEVPPGYPLSDLAGRCLQRFSAFVKRHASSRQTTSACQVMVEADPQSHFGSGPDQAWQKYLRHRYRYRYYWY